MSAEIMSVNREKQVQVHNGWVMLPIVLALIFGGPAVFIYSLAWESRLWAIPTGDAFGWGY